MPCLAVILALAMPRVLVVILWFFTRWFEGMFTTILWPVLGFFFAPMTLLWYSAVQQWFGGAWTLWPVVGMVVAVMMDLSPAGRGRRRNRE